MELFNLKGKVAIVTGSSRGIGRAIAENLARCGARVVISSRKPEPCAAVAAAIRAEGGDAIAIPANISDKAQVELLVAETRAQLGAVDILVCNAATNPYYGPSTGLSDETFEKVMRNNVLSNLWLCNLVRPDMAAKHDGAIVIISSITGLQGSAKIGAYGISKAADMQLARNLAVEWGPDNIRINCIAPGVIQTDFAKAIHEDKRAISMVENELPLRRIGEPDDISGIAVMLASRAGKYITGQTIVADGGWTIGASLA
ncbi:MAG: SDR family oxidoreductase [Pseudomonadota bacterium]